MEINDFNDAGQTVQGKLIILQAKSKTPKRAKHQETKKTQETKKMNK